jgi:DNA (cytosine-5)-methyltransferase 1
MFENLDYIPDGQMNIFDYIRKPFKIDKPIRLIELFGGVGSQAMALRNIGANFTHYRVIEWDKYAMASYNAIHGTDFETSDISKTKGGDLGITNIDHYTYIMTYSFP